MTSAQAGANRQPVPGKASAQAGAIGQPKPGKASTRRPQLRVVRAITAAPRAPFVTLVLTVLGIGLIGLLLLSSSLQRGAFDLRRLEQQTQELRAIEAELLHEVAGRAAPDELAQRAAELGMAPAEERQFLDVPAVGGDVLDDGDAP